MYRGKTRYIPYLNGALFLVNMEAFLFNYKNLDAFLGEVFKASIETPEMQKKYSVMNEIREAQTKVERYKAEHPSISNKKAHEHDI